MEQIARMKCSSCLEMNKKKTAAIVPMTEEQKKLWEVFYNINLRCSGGGAVCCHMDSAHRMQMFQCLQVLFVKLWQAIEQKDATE